MNLAAGTLRHRVTLQQLVRSQDSAGDTVETWEDVAEMWAGIEPMSARAFVASRAEQSQVSTRITIRYRDDVVATMRILHRGKVYNIEGVLPDKDSGLEYLTLPCSEGVNAG